MDTKIKSSFWLDQKVESLDAIQKLALLWLFTAHVNNAGWVECSQRRFEFETASPWQALLDATEALGKGVLRHAKGFWIRNYVRHQIGEGVKLAKNNMAMAIVSSLGSAPEEIIKEFSKEYPELSEKIKGLTKGLPSPRVREGGRAREGAEGEGGPGEGLSKAEQIYQAYPRKIARKEGIAAIEKVLKTVPFETLLAKTRQYADSPCVKQDGLDFVPYPATWFNRGQYEDDPVFWEAKKKTNGNFPGGLDKSKTIALEPHEMPPIAVMPADLED